MAKDPAFLFYPADASEDTQFMNRLERGCYFDILKAQKKFRKFNLALIQKVLGQDFDKCWPAIESVLEKDDDLYFIGWVENAIENRAEHSAKQKKRIADYWDRKRRSEQEPEVFHGTSTEQPKQTDGNTLESENVIVNENAIVIEYKEKESDKKSVVVAAVLRDPNGGESLQDVEYWTKQVLDGNDSYFLNMVRNSNLILDGKLEPLARDHLGKCARYNWHERMTTQQAFRHSLLNYIIENLNKSGKDKPHKPEVSLEQLLKGQK